MLSDMNYKNYPILMVDDEPLMLEALKSTLEETFAVHSTDDPNKALQMVSQMEYAVILSDQKMPKMPGSELLSKVKEISPLTARILITGFADIEAAIEAVNQGEIFRYIPKKMPRGDRELLVKQGIQWYRMHREMKRLQTLVRAYSDSDVIELNPERDDESELRTIFIEDYDEEHLLLSRKYYSQLEAIAQKNLGTNDPWSARSPEPELEKEVKDLHARFLIAGSCGNKAKAKELLKGYLSEQEISETVLNRTITSGYLLEMLQSRISDRRELAKIVWDLPRAKQIMYQTVVYGPRSVAIVQEHPRGIQYAVHDLSPGEKVVIQKNKWLDGNRLGCRLVNDRLIEAFEPDGNRVGTPAELFAKLINRLA